MTAPDPRTLADLRIHWRRLADAVDALLGVDPDTPCDCCGEPVGAGPVVIEETVTMHRDCEADAPAQRPGVSRPARPDAVRAVRRQGGGAMTRRPMLSAADSTDPAPVPCERRAAFRAFLRRAAAEVATWPRWKRDVFGKRP